jgi:hypothetical protein
MGQTFVSTFSNLTATENGALSFKSSQNKVLDFFANASVVKTSKEALQLFLVAFAENPVLALKALCYLRDIRDGQGRRSHFRHIFEHLSSDVQYENWVQKILPFVPTLGRYDDLIWNLEKTTALSVHLDSIYALLRDALEDPNQSGLAAKWMPRKGYAAKLLRQAFGMTPKQYRKMLVGKTNVVESKMCVKNWEGINFSHVPSIAATRYNKAFFRNAAEAYTKYKEALKKGEAKINASVLYPHILVDQLDNVEDDILNAQWKALPNYFGDSMRRILAVADVSGSMKQEIMGNTRAISISIALGMYIAERQTGSFKDFFVSFSEQPEFISLQGDNFTTRARHMETANWGYSTNLQVVFDVVLNRAVQVKLAANEMPEMIVIISDMEFDPTDECSVTNYEAIKAKYAASGYELPIVIFWNVASRTPNKAPVLYNEYNTVFISGFSPILMGHILKADLDQITPEGMMLQILSERYTFLD